MSKIILSRKQSKHSDTDIYATNDGETIKTSDLLKLLSTNGDISAQLSRFKHKYETSRGLIPETLTCIYKAIKKKSIRKSNILKLGSDFELKTFTYLTQIEQNMMKKRAKISFYYFLENRIL